MTPGPGGIALALAGILFLAFVALKLLARPRVPRDAAWREARARVLAARARARDRDLGAAERAAALREAAQIALERLGRPGLAASYAQRAERLDPGGAEAVGLLALALRRAARYRALERFLWRRLGREAGDDGGRERALGELRSLYEGPLHRPEIAEALRRLAWPR